MPKRIPIWIWNHLHSPITLRVLILVVWLSIVGLLIITNYIDRALATQRHNEILDLLQGTQRTLATTTEKLVSFEGNEVQVAQILQEVNKNLQVNKDSREAEHRELINAIKRINRSAAPKKKKVLQPCYTKIEHRKQVGDNIVITTELVKKPKCP
jgi:hypothetical protein